VNTPFWGPDFASLASTDPEIADVVLGELDRLPGTESGDADHVSVADAVGSLAAAHPAYPRS
jgi:hypothetical protein